MATVELKSVSYIYNKGTPYETRALDNINLTLTGEDLYALSGEGVSVVLVKGKTLHHCGSYASFLCSGKVARIGGKDLVGMGEQRLLDADQRLVALLHGRRGHDGTLHLHAGGDLGNLSHGGLLSWVVAPS
jgi:hypothetical protein